MQRAILLVTGLGLAACPAQNRPCSEDSECSAQQVCVEKMCRAVCNADRDCASDEACLIGACLPRRDSGVPDAQHPDRSAFDRTTNDRGAGDGAPDSTVADLAFPRDSARTDVVPDTHQPDAVPDAAQRCDSGAAVADLDGDSVLDVCDNCILVGNASQLDSDGNGIGNACINIDDDNDTIRSDDGDAVFDPCVGGEFQGCDDNCPETRNPVQLNTDWDNLGDDCDPNLSVAPEIETAIQQTPVPTDTLIALTSDSRSLWLLQVASGRLFVSPSGVTGSWIEKKSASVLGGWVHTAASTSLASDPARQKLYTAQWRRNGAGGGFEERLMVFDPIENDWAWGIDDSNLLMTHNLIVLDSDLLGTAASQEPVIRRISLTTLPTYSERAASFSVDVGDNPGWLSRVARWTLHNGQIYGIKNDWVYNPAPGNGDRLYRFDPASFVSGTMLHATDLGPLPWEIGYGVVLVALPAGWAGWVGALGGLFVVRGIDSPTNQDGLAMSVPEVPTHDAAVFDLASSIWTTRNLPVPMAGTMAAVFHRGKVAIKLGPPSSTELWLMSPHQP